LPPLAAPILLVSYLVLVGRAVPARDASTV
jgi:hypothetical protein